MRLSATIIYLNNLFIIQSSHPGLLSPDCNSFRAVLQARPNQTPNCALLNYFIVESTCQNKIWLLQKLYRGHLTNWSIILWMVFRCPKKWVKIHFVMHGQKKEPAISEREISIAQKHMAQRKVSICPRGRGIQPTFERNQQRSACEKVAVSGALRMSGHKNWNIPSLMIVNPPPSICEMANNRIVLIASMPEKTLVDAYFYWGVE